RRVAEELHLASSTVVKALALLKLPDEVQEQVESGIIPATTAYELAKPEGSKAKHEVADRIAREKLSRDEAVALGREATRRTSQPLDMEKTARNPPTPAPGTAGQEKLTLLLREARMEEDHAALEFSLSNGVRVTIATEKQATPGDIVAALSSVLE